MRIPSRNSLGVLLGFLLVGILVLGSPILAAGGAPSGGSSLGAGGTSLQGSSSHHGSGSSPCAKSAQDTYKSCRYGVSDDYYLALAICRNLPAQEQKDCFKQAAEDSKDAMDECGDQNEARLDVCRDLGGDAYHPDIDPGDFVTGIDNPYFPLTPGKSLVYETHTPDGLERDEVQVTHETKMILGVSCTVVHDVVTLDGEVTEDTFDWYAQDEDGNVWYFGEESKQYEGGELVGIDGSWKAGRDGAQPGIVMESHPRMGDVYRQEFLPQEAEDLAEVVGLHASDVVPYGSFNGMVETNDFSPLEPDIVEQKFYAPGIGTVLEIDADGVRTELVEIITE